MDSDGEEIAKRAPIASQKGRKNIRTIKQVEDLKPDTIMANQNERERILRVESLEKRLKDVSSGPQSEDELILDYDFERHIPLVSVHRALAKKLKSHQREGVKFMWNACYESLQQIKKSDGSGCIIAHCMGLGKTLQTITLVHTLLHHKQTGTRTVLICCPKNTLRNWINEFRMWITRDLGPINLYDPTRFDNHANRLCEIGKWQTDGGVCIMNYELFRILLEGDSKDTKQFCLRQKRKFNEYLCNPGPDLVVCDEGHVLRNEETKLSKVMSQIRTLRRIILTGTPMQNNLIEYYSMIQFVKPNILGSQNEFQNMFVHPILNGQYENSRVGDVQLMKKTSHVLHKRLMGCVQRFDLTTLKEFLPEKQEYVIFIALTDIQIQMYEYYMYKYSTKGGPNWKRNNKNVALFTDYQFLLRIWTHPFTVKAHYEDHQEMNSRKEPKKLENKRKKKHYLESGIESEDMSDSETWSGLPLPWWIRFTTDRDMENARGSNKLVVLLNILKECEDAKEKILVFSGSLYAIRMIEHFLQKINDSVGEDPSLCNMSSEWELEKDYLVLTGQTSSEDRDLYCRRFNDPKNTSLRLFLISTKAGGMGINLTSANRVVLFDVSWNPSHDIQSIFRIYRIGQEKPCFVYRFVASGTMEEKMYERQVAKQSISFRVVDEKQIARHYTQNELEELYEYDLKKECKGKLMKPKDPLLQKIIKEEPNAIIRVHEHESLLEHKEEEELHELEKNNAWTSFNNINNFESLPMELKKKVEELTPESFSPLSLEKVLRNKYPEAEDVEISQMMKQLMPRINRILEKPDFLDIMKKHALLVHNALPWHSYKRKKNYRKQARNNKRRVTDLTVTPGPSRVFDSNEDDSVIPYSPGNYRRISRQRWKPLKTWGVRNGREYGSPDRV